MGAFLSRRRVLPLPGIVALALLTAGAVGAEGRNIEDERLHLARHFEIFDFEPRGDTLQSRDRNGDGWPDYWEPVIDVEHPAYLINNARVVPDPDRPGLYRGVSGHVFHIPFDGTAAAVRTRVPKVVDADLAYEITAWIRTERLAHSIAEVVLVWMRVDEAQGEIQLERDRLVVPQGQVDWTERPLHLRINHLPKGANAVRVYCQIRDDPALPGADRHGGAWFDDIRIEARPKINVVPAFEDVTPDRVASGRIPPLRVEVQYLGLAENVPIEEQARGASPKRYSRSLSVTDAYGEPPADLMGRPLALGVPLERDLDPGLNRTDEEELALRFGRLGVYYLTVTLRGHNNRDLARVTQAVGLRQPPRERAAVDIGLEGLNNFGVSLGAVPDWLLEKPGALAEVIQRTGLYHAKLHVWPPDFAAQESQPYLRAVDRELREIRSLGARITGVIPNTPPLFEGMGMRALMAERSAPLSQFLGSAIQYVGPHVEFWQWGTDDDPSFSEGFDNDALAKTREALTGMTSAIVQAFPLQLDASPLVLPPPSVARAVLLRAPAEMRPDRMMERIASLVPDSLARMHGADVYPPPRLLALAPDRPAQDEQLLAEEAGRETQAVWLSLELPSVPRHTRSANAERLQMEDIATKAVIARALGIPRVFLGRLTGANRGLMTEDEDTGPIPRPAFLAARVLDAYLGGATYLGSFQLMGAFENYVFRHRDGKQAVLALWYAGPRTSAEVDIGGGNDLRLVDMAGNVRPLRYDAFPVGKAPVLILGMDADLALTRMSIRIDPRPPLQSRLALQKQNISLKNYFSQPLPGNVQIEYALDEMLDRERNWRIRPEKVPFNLSPGGMDAPAPGLLQYEVRPDQNSTRGEKWVLLNASLNTVRPVRLRLYRKTALTSDLTVHVERLREDDPRTAHLQMRIKWFPVGEDRQMRAITLRPYYKEKKNLTQRRPKVEVTAFAPQDTERPPVTVDMLIPVAPVPRRVWVGLEEEEGTRFYREEVTDRIYPSEEKGAPSDWVTR